MTNEDQQIDRPEEITQPDPQPSASTSAAEEAASLPVSTAEDMPVANETTATESVADPSATGATSAVPAAEETEPVDATEPADVPAQADSFVAEVLPEQPEAEPVAVEEAPVANQTPTTPELPTAVEADVDPTVPTLMADDQPVEDPQAEVSTADAVAEPSAEMASLDPTVAEEITASYAETEASQEAEEAAAAQPAVDYTGYSKADLVNLLDETLQSIKGETTTAAQFRHADDVLKQSKPVMDALKRAERQAALTQYIADTGSEEGFQFRTDDTALRYEDLYKQIKSQKNTYFQTLDKAKDANFSSKTDLLRRLRELVESDESNAGDAKTSWNEFKKIQDEWKGAGNINSPHNATLWATYHALVDRYYSNRNIYFELKELDRKRNATLKGEVIDKVEALAAAQADKTVTRQTIDEANALFEEYKHIGPAPKAEQEALWQRMKAALDTLYNKRRGQNEDQRKESAQLYEEKSAIYEELVPLTSFSSSGINDWNDKTKAVMAIQDRWNAIKGPMPREEGKELSKKFWAALKTFFANKGEFFRQLEGKREENLKAKTELCEQVEAILASGDESSEATQRVIEYQRQWKNIGQVPEKQKNSIFDRFKAACDAFFDKKRNRNQDTDREFEANLAKKEDLIARIEAAATQNADLSQLDAFKSEWNSIGFVPKKDKERIQKGYIAAINALVRANGTMSSTEKERAIQDNEAEVSRFGGPRGDRGGRSDAPRGGGDRGGRSDAPRGGNREGGQGGRPAGGRNNDRSRDRGPRDGGYSGGGSRDSGDYAAYRRSTEGGGGSETRRRISTLENDIATYRNNIEFFARSKNADQLRADIEKKIADAQKQLDALRNQE
ncbi:DUF349 domain-containing protein [Fibrella sp. HMF5335]|uniref:DUF349 domain-containing protein n=1 Tax=Fibrella rubiginis TaxID=2817060 RepID=A0A939GB24_9BACT|nr:DUF349 domain-containing protein [Fibrella rubiginis]MBO0935742.1 DUF349 domain-containing protein [Fibrella rubiginis]